MDIFLYCLLALLSGTLLVAAVCDATRYTIPNHVAVATGGLFLAAALTQFSVPLFFSHMASGAIVFAVSYTLWRIGLMGGGDVKFWAAAALWFRLPDLPHQILAVALAGGVLALALVSLRRGLDLYARTMGRENFAEQLPKSLKPGGPVPYGVAISAGTLWALFASAPGYFAPVLAGL